MGRWAMEWSARDPTQCWSELLWLWKFDGIKEKLTSRYINFELGPDGEESLETVATEATWCQSRSHVGGGRRP